MKETNYPEKITVRITPHQKFVIDELSKQIGIKKSTLTRFALETLINQYDKKLV